MSKNVLRGFLAQLLLAGLTVVPSAAQDLVVRGGFVFDAVADNARRNTAIVVRAGKIFQVDAPSEVPAINGQRVLELNDDSYVLPGMFDLHAHHAIDLFGEGRVDERFAYPAIFLANGVTSVFPAGEMNPNEMRELRLRIERGEQVGPRMHNSGPYFGSWRRGWDANITDDSLEAEIDYWSSLGVHAFKAKGITASHLSVIIRRAHAHGASVTGHLDSGFRGSVNPRDAIRMGIDRVEHFLGGDAISGDRPAYSSLVDLDPTSADFASIASMYVQHGVFFDATLTAYGYYGKRDPVVYTYFADEMNYLTPYMRGVIERRPARPVNDQFEQIYWVKRRTIKAFYDAGGRDWITLGTDHPSWGEFFSGFSAHRELHALVLSGIPAADALRIATINGARAMNVGSSLGSIEPGKFADFFVVRGNPLSDIRNTRNVVWVVKNGIVYDPANLLRSVEGTIGPAGPEEEAYWRPGRD